MKKQANRKGFTIIEVTLAMAFLAVLMVTIISIILSITDVYRKGLAIRAINATGTEIIEDLSRTINASTAASDVYNIDTDDDGDISFEESNAAYKGYYYERIDSLPDTGRNSDPNNPVLSQTFGVFCTGSYSYVWNTAAVLNDTTNHVHGIVIENYPNDPNHKPKLARIYDNDQKLCRSANYETSPIASANRDLWDTWGDRDIVIGYSADGVYVKDDTTSGLFNNTTPVPVTTPEEIDAFDGYVVELIHDDEIDLALYEMKVYPASQSVVSREAYFTGSFILATRRGGVDINSNNDFCRTNKELDSLNSTEYTEHNFSYCAVNKFEFSARSGGNATVKF